jgi:hypothetical protein
MDIENLKNQINALHMKGEMSSSAYKVLRTITDKEQALQLQQGGVSGSVFTKESFLELIPKIGFRCTGNTPFSTLIDKDGNNTKIRVGNDGIEFKNANTSFCVFFEYNKNKITLYEKDKFISIGNEDESVFINLYGF